MRYDIAIIGTGPAGLEAAITAAVRKKNIVLIGSPAASMKVHKAHLIRNYLGFPEISGWDLAEHFFKASGDDERTDHRRSDHGGLQHAGLFCSAGRP